MITINCRVDASIIKSFEVLGHASGSSSNSIICAAVSCLTRTACNLVLGFKSVSGKCNAPKPGEVVFELHSFDTCIQERLKGITDFLLYGLAGIVKDYPKYVELKINNKEWYNGSQERWW